LKKRVLFVCVENSFRSQIAEAYFNRFAPEGMVAFSAGSRPAREVHPNAVKLMLEEGIDLSGKKPQLLTRDMQENMDVAVIVCGGNECPLVYAKHIEEWNMPDPAKMPLDEARKLRDAIKERVIGLIEKLKAEN